MSVNATGPPIAIDMHTQPHTGVTFLQLSLAFAALISLLLWLQRQSVRMFSRRDTSVEECNNCEKGVTSDVDTEVDVTNGDVAQKNVSIHKFSKIRPPPTLDEFLLGVVEFTLIMMFFYLSDYRKVRNSIKANIYEISSNTHQLHHIPLYHFTI